jgi:hypothetical protein
VLIGDDWLAITRFGRCRRVRTDRLVDLSENPRVAGSIVLADEDGNSAEIDVRCLVRNPLIWQRIASGVRRSRGRGTLMLTEADAYSWPASPATWTRRNSRRWPRSTSSRPADRRPSAPAIRLARSGPGNARRPASPAPGRVRVSTGLGYAASTRTEDEYG